MHTDNDFIHKRHGFRRLMDHEIRTFGDDLKRIIGEERCDLDDHVFGGIEAGHFKINPSENDRILRTVLRSAGA